jgi:hypothetical protein
MALTREQHAKAIAVAGLHLAAAAGGVIALTVDAGEALPEARAMFLQLCTEMWDETVADLSGG